jgi:uncharacterized membrane protein
VPNLELIVLARVVHVMAGVTWAGATSLMAAAIVPIAARHGAEGAGRWTAAIFRRVGPMSGISALLTVLSGIYLFASLHANDRSAAGIVLGVGALAAILSLLVGFFVGRPAGVKLSELNEGHALAATLPADVPQELSGLRERALVSARLAAALLAVAVLSMASFRYAQVIF